MIKFEVNLVPEVRIMYKFSRALVSFVRFYFQFYASILQLSATVVYLSSWQAQQSASEPKSIRLCVPNSASVPNLDNASRHKAIKETENFFKLNSIKAKTNDNCSKQNIYIRI